MACFIQLMEAGNNELANIAFLYSCFSFLQNEGGSKEWVVLQHRLNRDGKKETIGAFLLCTEYRCMQAYLCVLCTSLSRDHPGCLAWLQAPYLTTNSPTWSKTQRRTPTTRNRKLPPQSHSCPSIIRTDVPLCPFSLTGRNMEGESPTSKRKSPVLEINTILLKIS